ncbi:leucine-rich_repeat domain-containing protein [Hexamita inflata]|uniref:Leucine-rich repeat domain-containing protein n=1 Tax=Hexamita inflata TaxID=28002 RepID=A0AA86RI74_9EUKA|nr:leucine-rich repeat domain-containing protein [Hexamita inflata]
MSKSNKTNIQDLQIQNLQYDREMVKKYLNKVCDGVITIYDANKLQFQFVEQLQVQKLILVKCKGINFTKVPCNITKFEASNCNIESITGIKQMMGLQQLNLSSNFISDISELKFMVKLQKLFLSSNKLIHLRPLSSLYSLLQLDARKNDIFDINGLRNLNITNLNLQCNKICEISALSTLQSLEALNLSYNQIVSVRPLKFCRFRSLDVSKNLITDIIDLNQCIYFKDFIRSNQKVPTPFQISFSNRVQSINSSRAKVNQIKRANHKTRSLKTNLKKHIQEQVEFGAETHINYLKRVNVLITEEVTQ